MIMASMLDDPGDLESELRPFTVDTVLHGERLDRALATILPEFSRSYLQQLVEAGAVTIGGKTAVRPSQKVKAGDEGVVELRPTPQSQSFRPEAIPLAVV